MPGRQRSTHRQRIRPERPGQGTLALFLAVLAVAAIGLQYFNEGSRIGIGSGGDPAASNPVAVTSSAAAPSAAPAPSVPGLTLRQPEREPVPPDSGQPEPQPAPPEIEQPSRPDEIDQPADLPEGAPHWNVVIDPPLDADVRYDPDNPPRIDFQYPDGFVEGSLVRSNLDSPFVAVRPLDSRVRTIYDLRDNSIVGRVNDRIGNKRALSPDGRMLAMYDPDRRKLELFDTQTGRVLQSRSLRLEGHLLLSIPSSRRLVCVTADELTSWSLPELAPEVSLAKDFTFKGGSYGKMPHAFSPGGRYLAHRATSEASRDPKVAELQILDLQTGEVAGTVPVRYSSYYPTCRFSPDGSELAVRMRRSNSFEVQCWSMQDGTLTDHYLLEEFQGKELRTYNFNLQWFPDGRRLWVNGAYILDRDAGGIVWGEREQLRGILIGRNRVVVWEKTGRGLNWFHTELLPEKKIATGVARLLEDRQKAADQATADQPLPDD